MRRRLVGGSEMGGQVPDAPWPPCVGQLVRLRRGGALAEVVRIARKDAAYRYILRPLAPPTGAPPAHCLSDIEPVRSPETAGPGASGRELVEGVSLLLRQCRAAPAGPADTPAMRLVRAAIAAAPDAPGPPECDRRFWAVIFEAVLAGCPLGAPDA